MNTSISKKYSLSVKKLFSIASLAIFMTMNIQSAIAMSADLQIDSGDFDGPAGSNYFADTVFFEEDGGGQTEFTTEAKSASGSFEISGQEKDSIYIGSDYMFDGISIDFDKETGDGSYIVEYSNGSSWKTLKNESSEDLEEGSEGAFIIDWERPSDWSKTKESMSDSESGTLGFSDENYFVRIVFTDDYDTNFEINQIGLITFNVKLIASNEDGADMEQDMDFGSSATEFSKFSDNTVYSYKNDGDGAHYFGLNIEDEDSGDYAFVFDGYVGEYGSTSSSDASEAQDQIVLEYKFEYAYKVIVKNSSGSRISGAKVKAGKNLGTECDDLGNGEYGCPIKLDDFDNDIKVSKSGYQTQTGSFDTERNSHDDNQESETLTLFAGDSDDDSEEGINLTISEIELNNNEEVIFKIKNKGDEDLASGKSFKINLSVSGDEKWYTLFKSGIDADETIGYNSEYKVSEKKTVKVCVDSKDQIDEYDEGDNCKTVSLDPDYFNDEDSNRKHSTEFFDEKDEDEDCDDDFVDTNGHYAEQAICLLYEESVVEGKTGKRFAPNSYVTRAEFVKMILLNADYTVKSDSEYDDYSDVDSDDWFYKYITFATKEGIIEGYSNGKFKPYDTINRAEALAMILRAADADLDNFEGKTIFNDVSKSVWYAKYVDFGYYEGIINGYSGYKFKPTKDIRRGEASLMLRRAWHVFYAE